MNGERKTGEGVAVRPLLTERQFRDFLGGMCERKFKQLRAAGVVSEPLELGGRLSRWTHEDLADTIARLPRRKRAPEPETLAAGRRTRIERIKAGAGAPSGVDVAATDSLGEPEHGRA